MSRVLSKNVMTMKFMKRKAEALQEIDSESKRRAKVLDQEVPFSQEQGDKNKRGTGTEETNTGMGGYEQQSNSAIQSKSLQCTSESNSLLSALPGRRSFGGANIAVERHYESIMEAKKQKVNYTGAIDDKDEKEMLKKYSKLVSLPRGQSQGQHDPVKHNKTTNKDKKQKSNKR